MDSSRLITLAIVPLIVWAGVVAYLLMLDRKLARLESGARKEQDDL